MRQLGHLEVLKIVGMEEVDVAIGREHAPLLNCGLLGGRVGRALVPTTCVQRRCETGRGVHLEGVAAPGRGGGCLQRRYSAGGDGCCSSIFAHRDGGLPWPVAAAARIDYGHKDDHVVGAEAVRGEV